jgi:hypothetical protein
MGRDSNRYRFKIGTIFYNKEQRRSCPNFSQGVDLKMGRWKTWEKDEQISQATGLSIARRGKTLNTRSAWFRASRN